jgi:predicted Zn finger-like uncharacterized protein
MYTQCPDCQTRFRVTAGALRAAHGTVRCGRCGSAFDALVHLSDALPRAQPEAAPVPLLLAAEDELTSYAEPTPEPGLEPSAESTIVLVDEGGAGEDITLEGERVSIDGAPEAQEEVYDLDATDEFEVLRIPSSAYPDEQEAERELEALIERLQREFGPMTTAPAAIQDARDDTTAEMPALLEPETIEPAAPALRQESDEPLRMAVSDETVAPPGPLDWEPPVPEPLFSQPASEPVPAQILPTDFVPPQQSSPASAATSVVVPVEERPLAARRWRPEPAELEQENAPERSVWRTLAWTTGSLLLALLLAGQLAHHYRHELLRDARLGPPLRAAYERLGIVLPPTADLAALELRQWGDDAREAGRLVVHATLTNRAGFEQPYPVLRLQFEDRFGSLIATRDFEPADYLKDPALAGRLMTPGASSEAELVLVDPGAEAVGYRLDLCLRESDAVLRCGAGPG